jgi:hypothetical protein
MSYMIGISIPASNAEEHELKIEIGHKIILTAGNPLELPHQVWMEFEISDFKEFLQKSLLIIELEEDGKA